MNKPSKKTGIVVQARMGSTRLPGKMMLPLAGKPVLERLIERLLRIQNTSLIIATTTQPEDDVLASLSVQAGAQILRGDKEDVLSRYVRAGEEFDLDILVRLTGDCPLMDSGMIQKMLHLFSRGEYDYFSNLRPRSFPRGLDCEIFTRELAQKAFSERIAGDVPEYVVIPYVNRSESKLKIGNYDLPEKHTDLRWTLDETADYELISKIYESLYPKNHLFDYADILKLYESNPGLRNVNSHVRQKSI